MAKLFGKCQRRAFGYAKTPRMLKRYCGEVAEFCPVRRQLLGAEYLKSEIEPRGHLQ